MERYFYFGEDDVATTGESCMFAASTFLGMTPAGAASTTMHFNSRNGAATDDVVTVTHTGTTPKVFMTAMTGFMRANQRNPFLIVHDGESGGTISGLITSVAVATAS